MARPWTSEQIPPAAEWVANNQKPLDMVVAASRRPKFYSPSPSFLNNQPDLLVSILLPGIARIREAARGLSIRAMWNLGEGRPMDAWTDILSIYRLSRLLVGQGRFLVEQLVGIALDSMANSAAQTLLASPDLTAEQIAQIRKDLDALPPLAGVAMALDQSERLAAIDSFVRVAVGGQQEMLSQMGLDNDALVVLDVVSVDWNLVLQEANGWYDRLVSAARMTDRDERNAAIQKINGDVDRLIAQSRAAPSIAAAVVSRQQRSEFVSAMMLGLFLPAVSMAIDREDEQNVVMQLTRLAAALAQFRAANGAYPEKLDELVPGVLKTLPNDPYSGKPLIYVRDGDGFLFYSVGANGIGDGGSSERMQVHSGHRLDDLDEADRLRTQIPAGADDLSVRAPRPRFELPRAATPGEP
jgi:hypothetical protein